jgi:NADH-quinone oxidoreductase subunit M
MSGEETLPLLSFLVLLPLLTALLLALVPSRLDSLVRSLALMGMAAALGLAVYVWFMFDGTVATYQFVDNWPWLGRTIRCKLGIDGFNVLFLLLATIVTPVALVSDFSRGPTGRKVLAISLLVAEAVALAAFTAMDLFFFFVLWEVLLVPIALVMVMSSRGSGFRSLRKMVLVNGFGSSLLFVALLYMHYKTGATSFDVAFLTSALNATGAMSALSVTEQLFLFGAVGLAIGIRIAVFPFHTWSARSQADGPVPVATLISGILVPLGGYAFVRLALPLFPDAVALLSIPLLGLAVGTILWGAILAYSQRSLSKTIACFGMVQMGLVLLGLVVLTREGIAGGLLQLLNAGLISSCLLLVLALGNRHRGPPSSEAKTGVLRRRSVWAGGALVATVAALGGPGTNGFAGEFLIFTGVFKEGISSVLESGRIFCWRNLVMFSALLALTGLIVFGIHLVLVMRRTLATPGNLPEVESSRTPDRLAHVVLVPVAGLLLLFGLMPGQLLQKTQGTVDRYVEQYQTRVMEKRNKATAERQARMMRELMQIQMRNSMDGGTSLDLRNIQWKLGPAPQREEDE